MGSDGKVPSIAAIVMTRNEAPNIHKCLNSLSGLDKVFLLDSASTDGTIDIASQFENVTIVQLKWAGYSSTFNEGIALAKEFDWLLRIDADEELVGDVRAMVADLPNNVAGVVVRRKVFFLGEPLRFGPHAHLKMLRLFRARRGRCELTSADEHIVVDGTSVYSSVIAIIDRDMKPFSEWITKHVRWAKKEAANVVQGSGQIIPENLDLFNRNKRIAKVSIYYRLPPYARAILYFAFRFFIQMECFGGRNGISWCVLQGLWYRILVDFYLMFPHLIKEEI